MRFAALGPLVIHRDDQGLTLPSRLELLLGLLLARAGHPVGPEEVADTLWEGDPPPAARKTIQVYVHRLRRHLDHEDRLTHTHQGYRLAVTPGEYDAHEFEQLTADAQTARERGDLDRAGALLDRALSMWRGPAFAGLPRLGALAAEAARLDERRIIAFEERVRVDFDIGRHAATVERLTAAAGEHPYRERLQGQLMLALYHAGRQVEALEAYRRTRHLLVTEVGVEPGAELRQIHQQILAADPRLDPPPAGPPPAGPPPRSFLPHDITDFVGRDAVMDTLGGQPPPISLLTGMAGVGKTALAVHWAHRSIASFPDGQLYINLRGYDDSPPLRPIESLLHLLSCLGVSRERLPIDLDDAAALYRSLLAGRRALIILDNARSVDQVRPLLPGTPGCRVLVTSRELLTGLIARDGARRHGVEVLPGQESLALLTRLLGADRVAAEPDAARRLAELCGGLPLALRIAAAQLADRPSWTISALVAALLDNGQVSTLAILGDEQHAVRAVLDQSYRSLDDPVARTFRLLAAVPGADFSTAAAAALTEQPPRTAEHHLDVLVTAHLVQRLAPDRYTLHDLVRDYVRTRTADDQQLAHALRLLLEHYRTVAVHANSFVTGAGAPSTDANPGGVGSAAQAMAWFEAERANLVSAVTAAASAKEAELACGLAHPLWQFFHLAGYVSDWITTFECALSTIDGVAEERTKYYILNSLGNAYCQAGRYEQAIAAHRACIAGREALGDHPGASSSRNNLCASLERTGRYEEALAESQIALRAARRHGDRATESLVLGSGLPAVYHRLGRYEQALDCLRQALVIERELASPFRIIRTLTNLGLTYQKLGRPAEALRVLDEGLQLGHEVGERVTEGLILGCVADAHRDLGDYETAIATRLRANELIRQAGFRGDEAESEVNLAETYQAAGRLADARDTYAKALAMAQERGEPPQEARALLGLARLLRTADPVPAGRYLLAAMALQHHLSAADAAALAELAVPDRN
ncbi:AfsR/SARP family transcriptional regulator [Catellatospora citrea]|uniref:SARP family transcriptional regulator n=1 Tax=Catellatospora citrea TaxID=53366 RepID=A0A8J3P127_9ACTN|nr:BTAD domain-containing putative transcriptional regulator [Catellatospora citrea]RKE05450.1 DNA-binding SARP family transcriptional activator [Catellatospora citrea]GIG00121.1 SARP family transcriptional regulator [Catellatospora citrea]